MSKRWQRTGVIAAAIGLMSVSTMALGLPWDVDMADSQSMKAYSHVMPGLPEGVVSQKNVVSPNHFTPNVVRGSDASKRLLAPVANEKRIEKGREMYQIYCYPCHGEQGGASGTLGPVAWTEAAPDRLKGISYLAGPNGVARDRDDQWIYLTIRNGGSIMPSYGHTMNDEEMWSIVHYIRTLPEAKQAKPAGPSDGGTP